MLHRDDRASMRSSIRRLLQVGTLVHEFRIVLDDGNVRTVESSARVRRDDAGKAVRIDGTISDITERVRAEDLQLKHYELARLQAALAAAANGAVTVEEAFQSSLRLISDHGDWLIGHLTTFATDHEQRRIVTSLWQVEDRVRFANLIDYSESFHNAKSGRFMTQVIGARVPVWIEDISAIPRGHRIGLALAAGLRCAFAFPVVVQNEVAAVLEFYAEDARSADT